MAWTAPADWAVSEVVTAAKMNAHVRDNLKYLKGQAGPVAIESELKASIAQTRILTLENTGTPVKVYFGISSSVGAVWDINRDPTSGAFDSATDSHARLLMGGSGASSFVTFYTANAANTLATERFRVSGAGYIGLSRSTPYGLLHGYDTISGMLKWEYDGVDGTARTVIPDGTGDVVYGLFPMWAVRGSGGTTRGGAMSTGGTALLAPGNNLNIYDTGAEVLQLQVSAGGAVTVQRTAGTLTYKVALWLIWL